MEHSGVKQETIVTTQSAQHLKNRHSLMVKLSLMYTIQLEKDIMTCFGRYIHAYNVIWIALSHRCSENQSTTCPDVSLSVNWGEYSKVVQIRTVTFMRTWGHGHMCHITGPLCWESTRCRTSTKLLIHIIYYYGHGYHKTLTYPRSNPSAYSSAHKNEDYHSHVYTQNSLH